MLATLRNSDRRWFELRAEPLKSPSPNWPGECRTDRGCSLAGSAPAPRWTRREGRSGPPEPLRKLLLRVSVYLDALVSLLVSDVAIAADFRHPLPRPN